LSHEVDLLFTLGYGLEHRFSSRYSARSDAEPPTDRLKDEAADRVEAVAEQIRSIGNELDRRDEAHAIARRLERTADYLRFRPAVHVASDVRDTLTRPGVLWFVGGALAALVAFNLARRTSTNR
jgi:hypothetical protein